MMKPNPRLVNRPLDSAADGSSGFRSAWPGGYALNADEVGATVPQPNAGGHQSRAQDGRVAIQVADLSKRFRTRVGTAVALDRISVEIPEGSFFVLLGPSGCGKTTLLRTIAGLERPDSGTIKLNTNTVFSDSAGIYWPPERRNIGMVFQSYALWPHMTVFDNVAYPLRARRCPKPEIEQRVRKMLAMVSCSGLSDRRPSELSGGQQQRIALSRALVTNASIVLFDEPLSNVDARVRAHLREELVTLHDELGFTALYVTHDQEEAMVLASTVGVMNAGHFVQIGTAREIYERPSTSWVADFVGTTNVLNGTVRELDSDGVTVETNIGPVRAVVVGAEPPATGSAVELCLRPEDIEILPARALGPAGQALPQGNIVQSLYFGSHCDHLVSVAGTTVRVRTLRSGLTGTAPVALCVRDGSTGVISAARPSGEE
jgi:ABC-type Fe3+/spermidine/putrescine transport system ATPase subunit